MLFRSSKPLSYKWDYTTVVLSWQALRLKMEKTFPVSFVERNILNFFGAIRASVETGRNSPSRYGFFVNFPVSSFPSPGLP